MRLVGGHSVKEGRFQMCHEGEWHSVCADSWSESGSEARTVCATLGYIGDSGMALRDALLFSLSWLRCS